MERRPTRRERRWDGPRPPHDVRWAIGTVGRVLIAVGLLMFGFVAYQLWGTGIEYRQGQNDLEAQFADIIAAAPTVTTTTVTTPPTTRPTAPATVSSTPASPLPTVAVTEPPPTTAPGPQAQTFPPILEGDAIARIEVTAIGLDAVVVAGVSTDDLKRAPGHYPGTPLPGQLGNAAIAGHRTTYGEPFMDVDLLVPGDEVVMTTVAGRFVYRVTGTQIVGPKDSQVIDTVDPNVATLTLTSCHPKWTADERIIISAALDMTASSPPGLPLLDYDLAGLTEPPNELAGEDGVDDPTVGTGAPANTSDGAPASTVAGVQPTVTDPASTLTDPTSTAALEPSTPPGAPTEEAVDAFDQGWFDDQGAFGHVALWGVALAMIAVGAYLASRAARTNWIGLLVGIAPFVMCLYFFFQNVNRLLPAAL